MKKRLLVMLLLLCLLLTALTATVAAAEDNYTGEQGMLTLNIKGQKRSFFITARYDCENDHGNTDLFNNRDADKLLSVQARKNGKEVSIAEWEPGDTILVSIYISSFNCADPKGCDCGKMDKTIEATLEFNADDFCHLTRTSTTALTATMEHIRGADVNDRINFKFYCYLYPLYELEHNKAGAPTCEKDGYAAADWYRCPCCGKCFLNSDGTSEITDNLIPKLGHNFNENGVCQRKGCKYHAEAYIYNSLTEEKTYCDTVANAISTAKAPVESVHVVSYERNTPITINKVVDLTVEEGVTVPEIRMESLPSQDTGNYPVNINNYGTVKLFSTPETVNGQYRGIFYTNHYLTERITAASTIAVRTMQILNTDTGTIGEINISQTDNPTPKVQVTNNGGTITTLSGSPKNVALCTGTGSYGTITSTSGTADQLLNTGCYFYFPNGKEKWVNSGVGKTVSGVIVSYAPFTVKVNRDGSALTATNGSYTIDNVTVGKDVVLSAAFTLNPSNSGLTVDESEITSRWYYSGESKDAATGKALTLNNIQYGVYDLIFEAKESTYGFTTSVNVKVNVNPPAEKTAISLKNQLTSDSYTKVYDGTKDASAVLPSIEFQLADEREIRISPDYYTATAEYKSPDCIDDNKIIVTVTLTPAGENYYTLTDGKIEVPATITPYDGEWVGDIQYKAFSVGSNSSLGSPHVGDPVLPYLQLSGMMYNTEMGRLYPRKITSKDGFQYSFYHLRPGATEPDPELDELLTADSVFTYPEEGYNFYAVVEPSLNYTGCITNSTAYFFVYDKYNGNSHTHDNEKTYDKWAGGSLSIATGGTATRYLSGAQPNVNVELALSQKKTLDLCLYNKAVHVIGSSHDQIYLVGGSTLVLSDCRKTGKVIGSAVASGSGGVAHVKNGTLSVYDVTLTGGIAKNGGAIVVDKDGTLNLYSGEISGNYVTGGKGGAIYIKSGGVVNMYGGTIRNNHAYSGDGGAIYVAEGGTLNLYGGTITGNTASGLGGGIYVEAGGMVNVKGAPIVKDNTANGKPSNLCICVSNSSPLLSISGDMTDGAQIGVSTNASCPMLLARGMQTDYSAYFIPDDANTFVLYNSDAKTLTLCAKPTATLEGDTLTISGNLSNTFVLLAAEYDADGKMLAVHSWDVDMVTPDYTCDVNPGAKIKCFLLRATSYTPVLTPFSPLA